MRVLLPQLSLRRTPARWPSSQGERVRIVRLSARPQQRRRFSSRRPSKPRLGGCCRALALELRKPPSCSATTLGPASRRMRRLSGQSGALPPTGRWRGLQSCGEQPLRATRAAARGPPLVAQTPCAAARGKWHCRHQRSLPLLHRMSAARAPPRRANRMPPAARRPTSRARAVAR